VWTLLFVGLWDSKYKSELEMDTKIRWKFCEFCCAKRSLSTNNLYDAHRNYLMVIASARCPLYSYFSLTVLTLSQLHITIIITVSLISSHFICSTAYYCSIVSENMPPSSFHFSSFTCAVLMRFLNSSLSLLTLIVIWILFLHLPWNNAPILFPTITNIINLSLYWHFSWSIKKMILYNLILKVWLWYWWSS